MMREEIAMIVNMCGNRQEGDDLGSFFIESVVFLGVVVIFFLRRVCNRC